MTFYFESVKEYIIQILSYAKFKKFLFKSQLQAYIYLQITIPKTFSNARKNVQIEGDPRIQSILGKNATTLIEKSH